jgi:hypothetical protein
MGFKKDKVRIVCHDDWDMDNYHLLRNSSLELGFLLAFLCPPNLVLLNLVLLTTDPHVGPVAERACFSQPPILGE